MMKFMNAFASGIAFVASLLRFTDHSFGMGIFMLCVCIANAALYFTRIDS